uniref:oocyte zinc finger protein XlCOF26-like n=1 Tax=Myxine glutinosa TaxID=7769 RepID=UPI00358E9300
MDTRRARGDLGPVPAWLKTQGLTEESLRAAVTGLGVEILRGLCARAEPAPVRFRIRALSARKVTCTMYVELCRYMESCCAWREAEWTVEPGCGEDGEDTQGRDGELNANGGPAGVRIKIEDQYLVGPVDKGNYLEDGRRVKLIKKFTCTSCSNSFTTKATLQVHMEKHFPVSTDKMYCCTDCPFSTHVKCDFSKHTRIHSGKKLHTCSVCRKEFFSASNLRTHTRIHTGERPFTCMICAKSFSDSSALKQHTRTHTGEKPYACSVCRKCFSLASNCQKHIRVHTGERPYSCKVCTRTFSDQSTLSRHTLIHTGELPYICTFCGKGFSRQIRCTKHANSHW